MLEERNIVDDKYEIIRVLGRGGMSTVYLARHVTLGIKRAIKEICREDCSGYETVRQSLLREANILRELKHPNLPDIIDIRIEKNYLWIIMEYIPGETLKEYIQKNGRAKESAVVAWGKQLCDVLIYLHGRNPPIIYRDLKPSNIMRKPDGQIVLIDFGTAKACGEGAQEDMICLGTKGFAAPEQYSNERETDVRTDIYCLGATLYYLLTGRAPDAARKESRDKGDYVGAAGLKKCILTCLQIEPERRYQSCEEVRDALAYLQESARQSRSEQKKIRRRFFVLLAGMLLCGMGAVFSGGMAQRIIEKTVRNYVGQAERTSDAEKKREYYRSALAMEPHNVNIYKSLSRQYIRTNDFQVQDAAELMNILEAPGREEGQTALEVLEQEDRASYGMFCYEVGIGYFYYMGTVEGKKAAQLWFDEACRALPETVEQGKKERASLYAEISSYYNTFLTAGEDKSGEKQVTGYAEFFHSLQRLNDIEVGQNAAASQAAAAYMISVEVAAEISNFTFCFQRDGKIPDEKIQKELDKIYRIDEHGTDGRIHVLENFREKSEINNLINLVEDASRKNALAAMYLKQGGEDLG